MIRSETNGFQSFLIGPDGSKDGWTTSIEFHVKRKLFMDDMKLLPSVDVVLIRYGDEKDIEAEVKYCPDCATQTLRPIETIDCGDEWKRIFACDQCKMIVNTFQRKQDDLDNERGA